MRPTVGFAAVKLIEDAGCKVVVPAQTCCGQPAYNSGDRATAAALARQAIEAFADCDYVVAPSGSCGGMLIKHYPELFAGEPEMAQKAERFAEKTHELMSFLIDVHRRRAGFGAVRRNGRLSRFLRGPAGSSASRRSPGCCSRASRA